MTNIQYFSDIAAVIEEKVKNKSCGHNFWHTIRVAGLANKLLLLEDPRAPLWARRECELLALCHDVLDRKVMALSKQELFDLLQNHSALADDQQHNDFIDLCSEFGFSYVPNNLVEMCVKDADNLDALGAIGIGRSFAYGGANGMDMYDADAQPKVQYKSGANSASTITHFEEKLLKLSNRMCTKSGAKIASHRHEIMVDFLSEYHRELKEAEI